MSISALEAQLEAQRAAAAQAVNELARQIAPATLKAQATQIGEDSVARAKALATGSAPVKERFTTLVEEAKGKDPAAVVVLAGAGLVAATTALISLRLALRPLFK